MLKYSCGINISEYESIPKIFLYGVKFQNARITQSARILLKYSRIQEYSGMLKYSKIQEYNRMLD